MHSKYYCYYKYSKYCTTVSIKTFRLWLYVIIMSCASFRVNPHSIVCLSVKELLAQKSCHIWSLCDSNEIRTQNQLVRSRTLNHLAKLAKWLSCVVSTYLYDAFDCILLSCQLPVSGWIHTLKFAWVSRNSLLEAGIIWEWDSKPQSLIS